MVVSHVDCAQIPRFIKEEIYNISPVQYVEENHGVADVAKVFILFGSKWQVYQSPRHYSRSSVKEKFEIKRANPGVMFHAHKEVVKDRSTEASVFSMTGKIMRFDIGEKSQAEAKHIGNNHQGSPVVANDCGLNEALLNQDEKQKVCYNPSAYAITLVGKHISSRRGRSSSDAAREREE